MLRSLTPEIMDNPRVPAETRERFHRQLGMLQGLLGNQRAILDALRRHPRPIRVVLDIGCGNGKLLNTIQRKLRVKVQGIDLQPPKRRAFNVPIAAADAARDRLPQADVAVCVTVLHHLTENEIAEVVRNAGRSVRRLIILDLVRHWLPLTLFTVLLAPFLMRVAARDGRQSIRRAYTPGELRSIVENALAGSRARLVQRVTPFRTRQIIDIVWS